MLLWLQRTVVEILMQKLNTIQIKQLLLFGGSSPKYILQKSSPDSNMMLTGQN